MSDDDKAVAEDYRQQRQAAEARKNNFTAVPLGEQLKWMDKNSELVLSIARTAGGGDENAIVEEYKKALLSTSPGSAFDDVNGRQILERVIGEIEEACHRNEVPIRSGVAYGISPKLGLLIGQFHVLETQASIIDASLPFLIFCNLITKALARSLPWSLLANGLISVCNDPFEMRVRLQQSPEIVSEWTRIFVSYIVSGCSLRGIDLISDVGTQAIRILLLRAVELFALAHEYGHHVMQHGITDTSEETADPFSHEYEADAFARGVCLAIGARESPPNVYSMFGVGGVVILGALELVRRGTAVLETGSDQTKPRERHPPFLDRIAAMDVFDRQLPSAEQKNAVQMRNCFVEIIEVIWEFVHPNLAQLHAKGIRPSAKAPDAGGWLPT